MRIVSICPSNTEIVAYLDLTSSLVGIDNYSDWPSGLDHLPRLGPDLDIDMDQVEKLNPDLVVASLSVPGMEKNIEELERRGLPYIVLNPQSLEDIADSILELGKATDQVKKAEKVCAQYEEQLEFYRKLSTGVQEKKRVYWEWWPKPVFTPGAVNWLTEISELSGAVNIFGDMEIPSVQTDWEEVKKRNPDVIFMVWVGVKEKQMKPRLVESRPGWHEMKAVQKKEIYVLEESLFCRPSPRLLEGLAKVANLLHPEVYPPYVQGNNSR